MSQHVSQSLCQICILGSWDLGLQQVLRHINTEVDAIPSPVHRAVHFITAPPVSMTARPSAAAIARRLYPALVLAAVITASAATTAVTETSLTLSPSSARSAGGQPVTARWRLSTELQELATATSHQKIVDPRHNTTARWLDAGLWLGVFPCGADVSIIPYRDEPPWPFTGPLTATSPWRFIALDEIENDYFAWSMDSKVRGDVDFVLFSHGYDRPVEEARATLTVTDALEPGQVRLARTDKLTEMRVQWNEAGAAPGRVVWWLEGSSDNGEQVVHVVEETFNSPRTVTPDDFCGVPATTAGWHDPGYTHDVVLDFRVEKRAAPGALVRYRVESDTGGSAGPFRFFVPRGGGDTAGSNRFLLLADMGCTYEDGSHYHWEEPDAKNTTAHLASWAQRQEGDSSYSELTFFIGDLAYATGMASKWDKHMTAVESLAAYSPLMVGKGNHEQDDATHPPNADSPQTIKDGNDAGGECGVGADLRYRMPYPPIKGTSQAGLAARGWYSIDASVVHFVMLNTELDLSPTSEQYRWLDSDLRKVDRAVTPWIVVMGHRPVIQMNHRVVYDANVFRIRPLLEKWKVDLALYGHEHYAEMTCPLLLNTKCAERSDEDADGWGAPVHAVIGNAGQSLTPLPHIKPHYDIYEAEEWGFSTLEAAAGGEELTLFFWGDAPEDQEPPLRFSHTLRRKYPRTATPQQ